MNIALVGYGKMGKAIEALAIERGHKIIAKIGRDGFTPSEIAMADVCIEFSRPEAGFKNIQKCKKKIGPSLKKCVFLLWF